jgi:hypothetical protein
MAGIQEETCSLIALWRQRGWMEANGVYTRNPTEAERREALQRAKSVSE